MKELKYNATVLSINFIHDELCIIRVSPDEPCVKNLPGQYLTLGLLDSEPRVDASIQQPRTIGDDASTPKMILRAYSVSCTMLDSQENLIPCETYDYQEYYISRVTLPDVWDHHPPRPRLTPRLFNLQPGSRLYTTLKPKGNYILGEIPSEANIVFAATGTGEAPHNAMVTSLLQRGHRGMITSLCCVRYCKDSGYLENHQLLMKKFPNYQYRLFTTREPENLETTHPQYVGKQYLQEVFAPSNFEKICHWKLDPDNTKIFLCGNPDMIGIPREENGMLVFPHGGGQPGVVEILHDQGFTIAQHQHEGNIHFEKYW